MPLLYVLRPTTLNQLLTLKFKTVHGHYYLYPRMTMSDGSQNAATTRFKLYFLEAMTCAECGSQAKCSPCEQLTTTIAANCITVHTATTGYSHTWISDLSHTSVTPTDKSLEWKYGLSNLVSVHEFHYHFLAAPHHTPNDATIHFFTRQQTEYSGESFG